MAFQAPKAFKASSFKIQTAPMDANAEKDSEVELTELQASFRERKEKEQARFVDATDSEYWTCFCFQNREQKETFLRALGLIHLGDKILDGMKAAQVLKVALPMSFPPVRKVKPDKKLASMAMEK